MTEATAATRVSDGPYHFSTIRPVTKAATGKPIKKPDDGSMNAPSPPFPPARSGRPRATSSRKSNTASAPRLAPSTVPQSMIPRLCAVIGTPKPSVNFGINASAAIRAANSATRVRLRSIGEVLCVNLTACIPAIPQLSKRRDRDQRSGLHYATGAALASSADTSRCVSMWSASASSVSSTV